MDKFWLDIMPPIKKDVLPLVNENTALILSDKLSFDQSPELEIEE